MAAGTSALLLVVGGGAIGVATLLMGGDGDAEVGTNIPAVAAAGQPDTTSPNPDRPAPRGVTPGEQLPPASAGRGARPADRTGPRTPAGHARRLSPMAPARPDRPGAPAAPPVRNPDEAPPASVTRTEVETREIPFETQVIRNPRMPRGTKRVETPGVPGVETARYLVTVVGGRQTDRELLDTSVTRQPQDRVVVVGSSLIRDQDCGLSLRFCIPMSRQEVCPRGPGNDGTAGTKDEDILALAC